MDPFTMARMLLGDLQLSPEQLAQLRALNTKYFTQLAELKRRSRGGEPDMADLNRMIASDIREMLTEEQRAVYDRNISGLTGGG